MRKSAVFIVLGVCLLFGNLYQKVKVTVLAYQFNSKKAVLNKLTEEKLELIYDFSREVNLSNISTRLSQEGLQISYAKEYVRIPSKNTNALGPAKPESLLVKLLGFSSDVTAEQP